MNKRGQGFASGCTLLNVFFVLYATCFFYSVYHPSIGIWIPDRIFLSRRHRRRKPCVTISSTLSLPLSSTRESNVQSAFNSLHRNKKMTIAETLYKCTYVDDNHHLEQDYHSNCISESTSDFIATSWCVDCVIGARICALWSSHTLRMVIRNVQSAVWSICPEVYWHSQAKFETVCSEDEVKKVRLPARSRSQAYGSLNSAMVTRQ